MLTMKNTPELQHVEMLISIVKHGSFVRQQKSLNISPPTLTIAINNLEEKLGTRLLNRSTRSLSLTTLGQAFLHDVTPVLNDYRRVIDNLNAYRAKPERVVRLNLPRCAGSLLSTLLRNSKMIIQILNLSYSPLTGKSIL
jgi:DNA-binding transcriptional LysR family regulator